MVLPTGGRKPGIPGQSRNELTDRILALESTLVDRLTPGTDGANYANLDYPVSFSIAWTGAIKNDSTVDNTEAINKAINAVAALGGGEVIIPEGTWYIAPKSGSVVNIGLKSNVTIRGMGHQSRLKVKDDAGDYRWLFSPASGSTNDYVENIAFRDFAVDHNASGNTTCDIQGSTAGQSTFAFNNFQNITVDSVSLVPYTGTNPLRFLGQNNGSSGLRITNCYFVFERGDSTQEPDGRYDTSTIYASASNIVVAHNMFDYFGDDAMYPDGAIEIHGPLATVHGNVVDNYGVGTWIVAPTGTGIDKDTFGVSCVGNVYRRVGTGIGAFPADSTYDNFQIVIADNTIHMDTATKPYRTGVAGILIGDQGFGHHSGDICVHDNVIYYEYDDRTETPAGASINWAVSGIFVSANVRTSNVHIHDNIVHNAPGMGFRIQGGAGRVYENIWVHHNTFVDCGYHPERDNTSRVSMSIVGSGDFKNVVIEDNKVVDTGDPTPNAVYAWRISTLSGTHTDLTFRRNTYHAASGSMQTQLASAKTDQASASLNFPSITSGSCAELTVTLPGVAEGDTVWASPANGIEAGLSWSAYASAANTVTVRVCNVTGSSINPDARNWYVGYQKRQV